jgi:FixJ family two-component response regulator
MAGQDAVTLRRHLDLVERTMTEVGWSGRVVRTLADQLGVSKRTIYRYRANVMKDLAAAYKSKDIEHDRALFLSKLQAHQARVTAAGAYGSLASMLNIEARVLGIDRPDEKQAVQGDVHVHIGVPQPADVGGEE